MLIGVLFALAAGLMWGLIFVGPLIVPDYSAALQSTGAPISTMIIGVLRDARETGTCGGEGSDSTFTRGVKAHLGGLPHTVAPFSQFLTERQA